MRHSLEFFLGFFIAGVLVGVQLARKFAIRLLDVVGGCIARNAEQLVEILRHRRLSLR